MRRGCLLIQVKTMKTGIDEISNESVLSDDSSDDDWNTFCAKQSGTSIKD